MKSSLLLFSVWLAAACSRGNPPSVRDSAGESKATWSRMRELPATLVHHGDGPVIEVPASAVAGEKFTISVTTYGGGCTREDRTDVETRGMSADVRPIQKEPADMRDVVCTADLLINARPITLSFPTSGLGEIRVHGRAEPGDSVVTFVRTVAIR